jgi:16S rRNA (guanine966-N2)-methyltransferase
MHHREIATALPQMRRGTTRASDTADKSRASDTADKSRASDTADKSRASDTVDKSRASDTADKRRHMPWIANDAQTPALVTPNLHAVKRSEPRALTSIRIIGGTLRNSKILVPDQSGVRPTPDRVRETVFNWLMPLLPNARVLDLFAGTGALGIEAISRGAGFAEFVESDAALCAKLTGELSRLKIADRARVTRAAMPGPAALAHTAVDIVFLDPPFTSDLWLSSLAAIASSGVLKPGGVLYLEAPEVLPLTRVWQPLKQSKAGAVHFALYRYSPLTDLLEIKP